MKKSLVFSLLCAFGLAAALPSPATVIPEKDWEYERLDDDHVVIHSADQSRRESAIDPETAGDIVVPSTLRNMQVVSIGEKAFYGCSKLTSVTIPEGVTNIAENAFRGCTSLTNVVFPASLKSIGKDAFYKCCKLGSAEFKGASLAVGVHAFRDCEEIATLRFSGDSVSFDKQSFSGCMGLQEVVLTAKSVTVGTSAFSVVPYESPACTGLTNVTIEAKTSATLGESAFASCTALRSVTLPISLTSIPTTAFSKCTALEAIGFPSNLTHIAYQAFDSCSALKTIRFAEGLASIDAQAFFGCSSVTTLAFPQSLTSVGDRAFERCDALAAVTFREGCTNLPAAASVSIGSRAFYQCSALANVSLPQTLFTLDERTFSQCAALEHVNLPTNLTAISASAFEDCLSLPTIDLPKSLKAIGNSAFFGCTALTGFLIPTNNVVSLGSKVFNNTKFWNDQPDGLVVNNGYILGFKGNPTSVALPEGCKAIPVSMFEGMTALKAVSVPDSVTTVGARAFAGSGVTNLSFGAVTTIGNSAFENCSSLSDICLADELTAIPGNAFKGCVALRMISIPETVAAIGEYAFYNCVSLEVVSGAQGVTSVGDYAFAQCPALLPFEFPNDVAYGDHVFQGCTWTEHVLFPTVGTLKDEYPSTYANIRSVVFSSSMSTITNAACAGCASLEYVRIPDGVTAIGARAFEGCSSMTSVVMSASVESVATNAFSDCYGIVSATVSGAVPVSTVFPDAYRYMSQIGIASEATSLCDDLFAGCVSLASVDIPWRVTDIGARAFYGCSNLTESVVVPEYVTSIGEQAFGYCYGLRSVDYLCDMPEDDDVASDVYQGTRGAMMSKVLPQLAAWQTATNSAGATILPSEWRERPIVWWATIQSKLATVRFSNNDYAGGGTNRYFLAHSGRQILELPEEPVRTNYTFLGWFTEPDGGTEIEAGEDVGGSVTYYAHWQRDDEEPTESDYDFSRANTYSGYLADGESVVGSVQIKFAKGTRRGDDDEMTAAATATIQLLGESSLQAKGTLHESGEGELVHARSARQLDITVEDGNVISGMFDGYDVVTYRDVFSSTRSDDKAVAKAALDAVKGKYTVVLATEGDTAFTAGYAALSVSVGAKGKTKVTGVMPDGAKVSATAQLAAIQADDAGSSVCCVPVVAPLYSKKGGFGFLLVFEAEDGGVSLSGVSDWIADKSGTAVPMSVVGVQPVAGLASGACTFEAELSSLWIEGVEVSDELSPDGTEVAVTEKKWTCPKADTVKFDSEEGYVIVRDNGNPAALKLTYAASTGLFKGSFKVYGITEKGKSKKYTATVNGGVVNGVGYGAAVIKKVGSLPVCVE